MKHSTWCKIQYAVYSLPTSLMLRFKGIKLNGICYSGGFLYASKEKNSLISIGRNCRFMNWAMGNLIGLNHRCILATGSKDAKLLIGDNCSFSGVSIWCFESISIGNHVKVGANCVIMDGDAHQDDPRAGSNKPIVIEDNVWLGASVTVMKGVTIGRNSLIGYGSIVTKDIPANVIAAGNPCKVIRTLSDDVISELDAKYK